MADFWPNFVAGFPVLRIQSNTLVSSVVSGQKRRVNSRQFVEANIGPGRWVASGSKAAPPNPETRRNIPPRLILVAAMNPTDFTGVRCMNL